MKKGISIIQSRAVEFLIKIQTRERERAELLAMELRMDKMHYEDDETDKPSTEQR